MELTNTKKLIISPDSELNLIPFEALYSSNSRYLVEDYEISYISSGRELTRIGKTARSSNPPVTIASPNHS